MSELQPPHVKPEDAGTHEMDTSDEDNFEDASDLKRGEYTSVPITRVEKTDTQPSHGEVPGTAAYDKRTQDAVPDELEIIPEGEGRKSPSDAQTRRKRSTTGNSIPKTVVEKLDPDSPSHGEVPGTHAHAIRQADAEPDEILKAPEPASADAQRSPTSHKSRSEDAINPTKDDDLDSLPTAKDVTEQAEVVNNTGDDFDDFEQGDEAEDFGAFDEGNETSFDAAIDPNKSVTQVPPEPLRLLDFDRLNSSDEILAASGPMIGRLFPVLSDQSQNETEVNHDPTSSFLTDRSKSLWLQLVAPPPLQPPNWVRSRIRRLFLVSLGVPVDLDEILPASKQKKLVLPSIDVDKHVASSRTSRTSRDDSPGRQRDKGITATAGNSAKVDRKRKGPGPPTGFDINIARLLCSKTSEALHNLTNDELRQHTKQLEDFKLQASQALQYWLLQRDNAHGDKEAFEEVIENLVKHAKKIRK